MSLKLRKIADRTATRLIMFGGTLLIVIILGMMGFILFQSLPLWYRASITEHRSIPFQASDTQKPLFVGTDDDVKLLYGIWPDGSVRLRMLDDPDRTLSGLQLVLPKGETLTALDASTASRNFAAGTSAGRIIEFALQFRKSEDGRVVPSLETGQTLLIDSAARALTAVGYSMASETTIAAIPAGAAEFVFAQSDENERSVTRVALGKTPNVIAVGENGKEVVVGFDDGTIRAFRITNDNPTDQGTFQASPTGASITAMRYLFGGITLLVGDADGHIGGWMAVRETELQQTKSFGRRAGAINMLASSWRNKSFIAVDRSGSLGLYHSTSERLLLETAPDVNKTIGAAAFSPKGDAILTFDGTGEIGVRGLRNDHPEISWATLFSHIWYESYDKPSYTWQSSAGTDDFEPKLSVIPLIFGTLKATLYAMLFAIPIAVLGALYTSQFAHPRIRTLIKPTVEIMAALPSVVIGFIAGLWLAPLLRDVLVEMIILLLFAPLLIIAIVWLFNFLPSKVTNPFRHGYELVLMIPAVLLAIAICYFVGSWIENAFFGNDVPHWLYTVLDIRYDQRNSIVIGVAMAFATMPIIFTITEDSLSSVPAHLTSASLALGASRWQTAVKVVLPAASAGIFSAIMIGFGRAVGETMIVLMATGNTPIMDWSIFNGMRTLSANIAVEIPEAPHGGTLYRTLFLSGLILFIMTFIVNTLAELIRQRLRKKYASM